MLEGVHYQNAYITRDIEKALDTFRTKLGQENVSSFEVTVDAWTPKKGLAPATNKLAFIWINNLQIELIQPVSGNVDLYADDLPEGDGMKFHHFCVRVDDWDSFRANVDKMGYPVVLEGGGDQLKYVYLNARDTLGHYIEYVWMTPERWTQLGGK